MYVWKGSSNFHEKFPIDNFSNDIYWYLFKFSIIEIVQVERFINCVLNEKHLRFYF